MNENVNDVDGQEMVWYKPANMKKFKDMTDEEKKEAVHVLRLGRNPWSESNSRNWQLRKISDELDREAHVYEIVKSYSGVSENIEAAKKEIIRRQKAVSEERAAVRENIKKYKPIISIYEEMQKYEIRSYLYEIGGYEEYRNDFEIYKELSERLEDHYGKSVEEVARFIEEQNGQLLYAKVQTEELSGQYRAISKYENRMVSRAPEKKTFQSFYEAVGHSEAKNSARDYGVLTTRLIYIAAECVNDVKIRVLTTPDILDGKATVTTTVTVLSDVGQVLEEYSSDSMSSKEFNQKINDTKYSYEMNKCVAFEEEEQADIYMSRQRKTENRRTK